jgi:hypothetical protein
VLSRHLDLSNGNNGNGLLRHELAYAEGKRKETQDLSCVSSLVVISELWCFALISLV